jgi:hypothetical protein
LPELQQVIGSLETYTQIPGPLIPTSSPGAYQLSGTLNQINPTPSSNTVAGGVYSVTNPNQMFAGFKAGSGVSQSAAWSFGGSSALNYHVDFNWTLVTGFPAIGNFPGISYQFPLLGTVGVGGNCRFITALSFYDPAVSPNPIGSLNINDLFNTPGLINATISGTIVFNDGNPLPKGSNLEMVGDVLFKAKADDASTLSIGDSSNDDATVGLIDSTTPIPVPEPSSIALALPVAVLLGLFSRRPSNRSARRTQ